jgi:hypothetical protein
VSVSTRSAYGERGGGAPRPACRVNFWDAAANASQDAAPCQTAGDHRTGCNPRRRPLLDMPSQSDAAGRFLTLRYAMLSVRVVL